MKLGTNYQGLNFTISFGNLYLRCVSIHLWSPFLLRVLEILLFYKLDSQFEVTVLFNIHGFFTISIQLIVFSLFHAWFEVFILFGKGPKIPSKMVQYYPSSTYWLKNVLPTHLLGPKYPCHPPFGSKLTTYLTVLYLNYLNIF